MPYIRAAAMGSPTHPYIYLDIVGHELTMLDIALHIIALSA
jgi:hypothetical protein